jgi:hypothetical protein
LERGTAILTIVWEDYFAHLLPWLDELDPPVIDSTVADLPEIESEPASPTRSNLLTYDEAIALQGERDSSSGW